MSLITIPFDKMMSLKDIKDPRTKWAVIGSDKWKYDFGLKRFLLDHGYNKIASTFYTDYRDKKLWELIQAVDISLAEVIATYYGFDYPELFKKFISDVFNNVAATPVWHKKTRNAAQMDHFPYFELHANFIERFVKKEVSHGN